jgi:predicted PurR-regulated permease PerM
MTTTTGRQDIARTTLGVVFIGLLILTSLWIMRPFLPALIWATMIVVSTWPLMRACESRLWGKRSLAVATMTAALLLLFVIPFSLAINTILDNSDQITESAKSLATATLPPAPQWVADLPLLGSKLARTWNEFVAKGASNVGARLAPYTRDVLLWLLSKLGGFGMTFVHFLLTVVISAIMYAKGEVAVAGVCRFARRLADARGENSVYLAGQAIRGVAMGVVVTALVQSLLGGIGLLIAGAPIPAVLTAVMFMLCIAQVGPLLVLIPVVVHTYWAGDATWGTFLLVWSVVVGLLDNFLRPVLIKRGADLPLLLIFAGVIGGLFAFGIVGIFVGPVVLAVAYTLLDDWTRSPVLEPSHIAHSLESYVREENEHGNRKAAQRP